jgi:hypothetical protein
MTSESKKEPRTIRIDLTEAQSNQIKQAVGAEATTLEFNIRELEERVTPRPMESI